MPELNLNLKRIISLSRFSAILPTLIILNLLFGWIFFGFLNWLFIGLTLITLFMINIALFAKSFKVNLGKRNSDEDIIDIKGNTVENEQLEDKGYHGGLACPHCDSCDTILIEPHDEMNEYECLKCGIRFEVEE